MIFPVCSFIQAPTLLPYICLYVDKIKEFNDYEILHSSPSLYIRISRCMYIHGLTLTTRRYINLQKTSRYDYQVTILIP
jgi:hypothetical protein